MKKWVCPVSGYDHEGDTPPEKCPVCKVPGERFTLQAEELTWAAEHVLGVGKVFGADVPVILAVCKTWVGQKRFYDLVNGFR